MEKQELIDIIRQKYGIEVDGDFEKVIVEEIYSVLNDLPPKLSGELHKTLEKFVLSTSEGAASMYQYGLKRIVIAAPFGVTQSMYAAMNKADERQQTLMDLGTLMELPSYLSKVSGQDLSDFEALHEQEFLVSGTLIGLLTDLRNGISLTDRDLVIDQSKYENFVSVGAGLRISQNRERHIMGGVSYLNCNERLLPWTIRHEIGHAVDHLIDWSVNKAYREVEFGGWKKYKNFKGLLQEYRCRLGSITDDGVLKRQCMNYPFTFNDGGGITAGPYTFMMDEYGKWIAYLTEARRHAVSNYQFSAPKEWFAEAFAAYYGSNKNIARETLCPSVCRFFSDYFGD